jgi:hypothetical protein
MRIATQKKILWLLLLAGAGSCLFCAVVVILFGIKSPRNFPGEYAWFGVMVTVAVYSFLMLRRCYRLEPARSLGFRQLSLAELVLVSLFAGLVMTVWRAFAPGTFADLGVVSALMLTGLVFHAVLAASVQGYFRYPAKAVLVAGIVLYNLGVLACAASLAAFVMGTIFVGPIRALDAMYRWFTDEDWVKTHPVMTLWWLGYVALLPGWVIRRFVARYVKPDTHRAP